MLITPHIKFLRAQKVRENHKITFGKNTNLELSRQPPPSGADLHKIQKNPSRQISNQPVSLRPKKKKNQSVSRKSKKKKPTENGSFPGIIEAKNKDPSFLIPKQRRKHASKQNPHTEHRKKKWY